MSLIGLRAVVSPPGVAANRVVTSRSWMSSDGDVCLRSDAYCLARIEGWAEGIKRVWSTGSATPTTGT